MPERITLFALQLSALSVYYNMVETSFVKLPNFVITLEPASCYVQLERITLFYLTFVCSLRLLVEVTSYTHLLARLNFKVVMSCPNALLCAVCAATFSLSELFMQRKKC